MPMIPHSLNDFTFGSKFSEMKFKIIFLFFIILIIFFESGLAQSPINGYAHVTGITGNTINVSNVNETYDTFEDGENIIIMQMQDDVIADTTNTLAFGDLGTIQSAGLYEYAVILSHTELAGVVTSITVSGGLTNIYNIGSNSSVQVISYPMLGSPDYTTTADITGLPWDGNIGGVIAFEVNGTLNLNNNISADGIGFRGGQKSVIYYFGTYTCDEFVFKDTPGRHGGKGEGIYKNSSPQWTNARGKILNGAGGGNHYNAGGGGGGGYTKGGDGGPGYSCANTPVGGKGGIALSPYIDITAARLYMGGGGGGGQQDTYTATDGAAGGGIIIIKADKIKTPQTCSAILISADGNSNNIASSIDGGGGAGAGGTVTISCPMFDIGNTGCLQMSANGGKGGDCTYSTTVGGGGGGGQGSIIYTNCIPAIVFNNSFTKNGKGGGNDIANSSFAENGGGIDNQGIFYRPQPIGLFGNSKVCYGNATQFTDSSSTAGTISSWAWNFGDTSSINNIQSPSYLFPHAGNYNVTLSVNNSFGCADTITKSVQVYYNPTAGFTHSDMCFRDTTRFANTSSVYNTTSIAGYLWGFGDNSPTSSLKDPTHFYSSHGIYNVTLVTTTADGCSNAATIPVNVYDAPASAFTFPNACLTDSASFTNTSLSPSMGTISNWSWNFGDVSASNTTMWSPNHLYGAPGTYNITLITHSSNLGCADTLHDSIVVYPMPVPNFSFSNVCLEQVMNFYDSSIVSSGSIAGRIWNFGDGSPSGLVQNPNHTYSSPGTYAVKLTALSNHGCKDSILKNSVVHPLPSAQFSRLDVCDGSSVHFTDLSSILATDTIHTHIWDFGDASAVSTGQNEAHLYSSWGTDTVKLLIVSSFGCRDSISKIVTVNPNPVVKFTAVDTIGCEPLFVSFQNLSSIPAGDNAGKIWDFGDGSPAASAANPIHSYSNDSLSVTKFYSVTLTVTSDSGCVSSLTKHFFITVFPKPAAVFTAQPQTTLITNPVISIVDLSAGGSYWHWNFGDQDTSSVFSPLPHTYADTGTYTITLITSTHYGCSDTAYQTVVIEPDFLFYIPNSFTPDGDGINDSFTGKGIFIREYSMSIFDRWGNLIFFTDDITKPWDGKANHGTETSQRDVYVYSISVTDFKNKKHSYKGTVTLVR